MNTDSMETKVLRAIARRPRTVAQVAKALGFDADARGHAKAFSLLNALRMKKLAERGRRPIVEEDADGESRVIGYDTSRAERDKPLAEATFQITEKGRVSLRDQ